MAVRARRRQSTEQQWGGATFDVCHAVLKEDAPKDGTIAEALVTAAQPIDVRDLLVTYK
jgi:pyruvate carboxylase